MSAPAIRAAVVGAGRIGTVHALALAQDPRVELVGVVDADEQRATELAERARTAWFRDVRSLLRASDLDAVTVAVPEGVRREVLRPLLDEVPAFLLEKPLSPSLPDASALVREAESSGARVMVNFILRSDVRYESVAQAVANGVLGEVVSLAASRRGTAAGADALRAWTGLLISTGIHDIDAMTWIAGAPVERVYAEAVHRRGRDAGEDAVVATLRFASGTIGQLDTSWVLPSSAPAPLDARLEVVGTSGSASVAGSSYGLSIVDETGYRLPDLAHWPVDAHGVGGSFARSVGTFIGALKADAPFPMSLREAWAAESVVDALLRSMREQAPKTPSSLE